MQGKYKIAVLDMNAGRPNEGMRCINMLVQQFLDQKHIKGSYDVFDVRVKNEIPKLKDYDMFISSGGPGTPLVMGEPWENAYFNFLDAVLLHNLSKPNKKHMFLICHSFQMACLHWDLAKVTKRRSTSFGVLPMHKTKSGQHEVLFQDLDDPFYAVDSRDYQVVGPKEWKLDSLDGQVLCIEKERPNVALERAVMAIRFSNEIFGTQFHPEADAAGMTHYFKREDKKAIVIKKYGKRKYKDMLEHLNDDDKIMKTNAVIIPRFLKLAAEAIEATKSQLL
ncbi:type 1 glutamine amidotransferase [Maribacter chungangensis]|uniref:Type 1 glutamine amidotransferase n=1 Tax=Maribacter chungangensis TaxID=1069117 RepID=A0ABW3B8I4_9FLAO